MRTLSVSNNILFVFVHLLLLIYLYEILWIDSLYLIRGGDDIQCRWSFGDSWLLCWKLKKFIFIKHCNWYFFEFVATIFLKNTFKIDKLFLKTRIWLNKPTLCLHMLVSLAQRQTVCSHQVLNYNCSTAAHTCVTVYEDSTTLSYRTWNEFWALIKVLKQVSCGWVILFNVKIPVFGGVSWIESSSYS